MKLIGWIVFYLITFISLMVGMYFGKDTILNKTKELPILNETPSHLNKAEPDTAKVEPADSVTVMMDSLLSQLNAYVAQLQDSDNKIRSQKSEINKLIKQNQVLQNQIKSLQELKSKKLEQENNIQALAKTLAAMKIEELKPIFAKLPDDIIMVVYNKSKAKDRSKFFNSLSPERASKIMRRIAGNLN